MSLRSLIALSFVGVFCPFNAAARCLSQGLLLVRTTESAVAPLTLPSLQ